MSIAFTILCTRSPKNFLRRRGKQVGWKRGVGKLGGLALSQRALEVGDDIPDDNWNDQVVAVIVADGALGQGDVDAWVDWSEALAEAARGAIYDVARDEYSFVWADDPRPFITAWTERRIAAGEIDELVARIERIERSDRRMYAEHQAMRDAIVDVLRTATKKKKPAHSDEVLTQLAAVVFDHNEYDKQVHEVVLALTKRPNIGDAVHVRANLIHDNRARDRDNSAPLPTTTKAVRELYDHPDDASCTRRRERFEGYHGDQLRALLVDAVVEGWTASAATAELVIEVLPMTYMREAQRKQLEELGRDGVLATKLGDIARAWRDAAGGRNAEYSMKQYAYYERYRNDDMVRPSDRGMDMAMYRPLNDALFGRTRKLPRMPEPIIVMICDRRFDEAREAYIALHGTTNADDALRDAIEYFAPDET